jgi:hypothetical protein
VACAPEESAEVLSALLQRAAGSEAVGERDAALHALNFLIQWGDVSPILDEALALIFERLSDPAPRVRDSALYCVHALLRSILIDGDECPFAELVPRIGQRVVEIGSVVVNLIADDPAVATTAASATADFVQFPKFPHAALAMGRLLSACVSGDIRLSEAAFSALQNAAAHISLRILHRLLAAVADVLAAALERTTTDFRIYREFYRVLQNILIRVAGQIPDQVERLWTLMSETFSRYPDEAASIILPLAALARAAGDVFVPCLPQASEFILAGLRTFDREQAIPWAAQGVSLLCDSFDLTPFTATFLEALTVAMADENVPLQAKQFVAAAIGDLAKTTPGVFASVAENVIPPVVAVIDVFPDVVDALDPEDEEFDIDTIVIAFAECLKEALSAVAAVGAEVGSIADALFELLEFVGGLKEHGDALLSEAVCVMEFLIEHFPEQMRENFQDEPGFELVLRLAEEAGVNPEVVEQVVAFAHGQ